MGEVASFATVCARAQLGRQQGRRLVLANGAFDLLHVGHLRYLTQAKTFGDVLVVAINSDESVRQLKGADRPAVPQDERAELVAALAVVDWVFLFDAPNVIAIIEQLRPDVHAKGTDYTVDTVPEAAVVRACGGIVAIAGDPKNHSTTALLARLPKTSV